MSLAYKSFSPIHELHSAISLLIHFPWFCLKTKGQKIFLKFDEIKHDNENNLMAYVYLKNKTFLNAHLIKNGLADIELSYQYKTRDRFLKYKQKD